MVEVRFEGRQFPHLVNQLAGMLALNKMAGMSLDPPQVEDVLVDVPLPGGESYMIAVLGGDEGTTNLLEYLPGGVRIFNFYPVPLDTVKNAIANLIESIGFSEFTIEDYLRKILQPEQPEREEEKLPEA